MSGTLLVLGYYVVAFAVLAAWVYRDHAATAARIAGGGDPEPLLRGFVTRLGSLLAVLAGAGVTLALFALFAPRPAWWVLAGAGVGGAVLTGVTVRLALSHWKDWFGVDPLSDLRGAREPAEQQ
jgi:hypothetical protein